MKKIRLVLFFLLLVSQGALGVQNFYTGNTLMEYCKAGIEKNKDIEKANACLGYVAGFEDLYESLVAVGLLQKKWCLPENASTSLLAATTLIYLTAHPDELHLGASGLVINAFREAYPCN